MKFPIKTRLPASFGVFSVNVQDFGFLADQYDFQFFKIKPHADIVRRHFRNSIDREIKGLNLCAIENPVPRTLAAGIAGKFPILQLDFLFEHIAPEAGQESVFFPFDFEWHFSVVFGVGT